MVFAVTRTEDVFKEDEIFVQLWPWILKVQPERQGNNVIPVASQDLQYKEGAGTHSGRISELAGVSLAPFPGTSFSLLAPHVGMHPCFHGTQGLGLVLCPSQPLLLHSALHTVVSL